MPTYQYACTNPKCGERFELVQSFTDPAANECPICGSPVRKVFSAVGVVFKGSGFYRNDSRSANGGSGKSSKDDAGSSSGSEKKTDAAAKSGDAKSGDAKSSGASDSGSAKSATTNTGSGGTSSKTTTSA